MALLPIWRDYKQSFYTGVSSPSYVDFKIQLTDTSEIIYSGRAYRTPGGVLSVQINDVIANWLANVLPYGSYGSITLPVKFDIYGYIGNAWVKQNANPLQFINNWSYDESFAAETSGLCFPINGRVRDDQPIPYTGWSGTSVVVTYSGIVSGNVGVNLEIADYISIYDPSDLSNEFKLAGVGTAVFTTEDEIQAGAGITITFPEGGRYKVVDSCARYALYYVNAYGGWDTLLVEGNVQESDAISRFTKENAYNNTATENRWKDNFVNEMTKSYVLHTGWLTDAESARMHHLLESTNVYLYDFSKLEFHPITITNSTCEYKTCKSIGNRLVDYEITCDLARYRVRR